MLGKRIKMLRERKDLSQTELGKCLGVSKQTVSNWENENVMPSMDMFLKLIEFFHETPNYLLGYEIYSGIDVSGLSETEIEHLKMIADDLRSKYQKE